MQPSPLEQLGLGRRDFLFLEWHSSLSILTCLACTLGHWKKLNSEGEGGQNAVQWPPASTLSSKAQHASIWRGRDWGYHHLCFAYEFLSPPSNRRSLLPEQADIAESHAAELYSRWGKNLLWINPCQTVWSGLDFISCCVRLNGALLITIDIFEALL